MGAIGMRTLLVCASVAVFEMAILTVGMAVNLYDWKWIVTGNVLVLVLTFVIGGTLGAVLDLDTDP